MASHPGYDRAKDQSQERIATPDEVREAIKSLTDADTAKLAAISRVLAFSMRRQVWGSDEDDLLQEAMYAVLHGNRKWCPSRVNLIGLLIGAMSSIADNLKKKGKRERPVLESELIKVDEAGDELPSPLETSADPRPDAEALLLQLNDQTEDQLLEEVEAMFKEDLVASLVLQGRMDGMKGPDIMVALGIDKKEFDAAVKRIRRGITARWPKRR